jgi:hypothetical protein
VETKHTPGPWRVDIADTVKGPNGERVADAWIHEAIEVSEANARLIAAAPDLLAACESLSDWLEYTMGAQSSVTNRNELRAQVESARAAIARATVQP